MKKSSSRKRQGEERILVLESDETLLSSILSALREVAPEAVVDQAANAVEADRIAANGSVALVVLDLDTASEAEVVRDLRARCPKAPAIVLVSADIHSEEFEDAHVLEKPFADSAFLELADSLLRPGQERTKKRQRILVIDDSLMMLKFVGEILTDANYEVVTAGTAQEGLHASRQQKPDLILLDYLLPDLRGDELSERFSADEATADVPVVFMSGFGADLENAQNRSENILGILRKPFTTDTLLQVVEENLSKVPGEGGGEAAMHSEFTSQVVPEPEQPSAIDSSPPWNEPESVLTQAEAGFADSESSPQAPVFESRLSGNICFSGDTAFFSFSRALRVVSQEKLTGTLRSIGPRDSVDLYAREGSVVLVTTRDGEAYCAEAPVTLVNVDADRVREAREIQSQTGCPLFITLAREELILRDPALQLIQHYGQKLFAQQWSSPRVRFAFEETTELPDFTGDIPGEEDIEHWMLSTLRFVQAQDVAEKANYDPECIPAFTRDGFERVQKLRLTVAEAQFASQFNGARSITQIARNLRLDLRFARLTLFRFIELNIVECWPPDASEKTERGGLFKRFLGRVGE